jgi:hypothetical protein
VWQLSSAQSGTGLSKPASTASASAFKGCSIKATPRRASAATSDQIVRRPTFIGIDNQAALGRVLAHRFDAGEVAGAAIFNLSKPYPCAAAAAPPPPSLRVNPDSA